MFMVKLKEQLDGKTQMGGLGFFFSTQCKKNACEVHAYMYFLFLASMAECLYPHRATQATGDRD